MYHKNNVYDIVFFHSIYILSLLKVYEYSFLTSARLAELQVISSYFRYFPSCTFLHPSPFFLVKAMLWNSL